LATIAFLIDTLTCDTAGTQRQLIETIRRLQTPQFTPHLICLSESPWLRTASLPCTVHVLGYKGFIKPGFPAVVERLHDTLETLQVDVVHTFFDEAIIVGWLGTRRLRRQPVLLSSRRDMGLGAGNSPWYHRLFPMALRLINPHYDGIIANSEAVKTYVSRREATTPRKIAVIRNGVELPVDAASERPTGAGPSRVGIVASLTPVKRHDVLLRAFASLPDNEDCRNARLIIIGEGPEGDRLHQLAQQLGIGERVEFTGATTDVGSWLRQLDVAVLCSDREGLSNAILEYMAWSLPTVATAVGGNTELVNEERGLLVAAGDVEGLASAMARLITDPMMRQRLGAASRQYVEQHFSWPAAMTALTDYYRAHLTPR
jgi:glycosyltransferase involved in cell wall biosynthesis